MSVEMHSCFLQIDLAPIVWVSSYSMSEDSNVLIFQHQLNLNLTLRYKFVGSKIK